MKYLKISSIYTSIFEEGEVDTAWFSNKKERRERGREGGRKKGKKEGWMKGGKKKRNGNVTYQRRQWQPTPVLLPGKSHGRRSLVGYSPWGHKELDAIE